MHSTDTLEDDYFGSGKRLWYSINKHGKDKHTKEILEFLPDRVTLAAREKELVCDVLLEDKLCLNLKVGGSGGWNKQSSANGGKKTAGKTGIYHAIYLKEKPGYAEEFSKKVKVGLQNSEKWKNYWASDSSLEHKKKLSESSNTEEANIKRKQTRKKNNFQQGENNSQWGKKWMNNGSENKSVKSDEVLFHLDNGFLFGRIKKDKPLKVSIDKPLKVSIDRELLKKSLHPYLIRYLDGESLRQLATEYGKSHVSLRKDLNKCFSEFLNGVKHGSKIKSK